MELYLQVVYKAKAGCGKKFVEELNESGVAEAVRKEDGCKQYDYFFAEGKCDSVLLLECWESAEKQEIHLTQPHIKTLKEIKEKYIIDTKIDKFSKI